ADVMKKISINSKATMFVISLNGSSANMANNASSTFVLISSAKPPTPNSSMFNAVPPNVENHNIANNDGTINTPATNSRIVRPLEILAINNPINGAHEMCQAQKKIVFVPSQSLSEKGVNVNAIGMTLAIYPPKVVTKLSKMKSVGPKRMTNISNMPAIDKFVLLNILMPRSSPLPDEMRKRTVTTAITTSCVTVEFGIEPKTCDNPPVICIALRPKVVATPVHVAMTANISIVFPIGPATFLPSKG